MKKLALILSGLILSLTAAMAQTTEELINAAMKTDMSSWSFEENRYEVDGIYYQFDKTNGLARVSRFAKNDVAPEHLSIPETVIYDGATYVVVAMISTNYNYSQVNTTKVTLPKTLRQLGEYAFYGYDNLKTLTLPASLEYIDRYVFSNWTNRTIRFTGEVPPTVAGTLGTGHYLKLIVPASSFRLYSRADYIEDHCVISDDITQNTVVTGKVDNGELGYVVVADALPEIRTYADVNKLIISEGTIDETDWYAIRQMPNLIELDLSGLSITEMPYQALKDCWQIERVTLPPTLEAIRGEAFYGTGVDKLVLPASLRTISGGENFARCDSLSAIAIPEGVESLPTQCFYYNRRLQEVSLPSTLNTMGIDCFTYCDLLKVTLPGALTVVPERAFFHNQHLTEINFEEGVAQIDYSAFAYCTSLPSLTFPKSMRKIGMVAFNNDISLSEINFNEGLEEIDQNAFQRCEKLVGITLPSSLQFCLEHPFIECPNIAWIESRALIPPTVRTYVPTYAAGHIQLYVPLWSFQEYMTTPGWLEYQDNTHIITDNLPENVVINKDFEFVLREEDNVEGYTPNVRLLYNTERIDDGFGNIKVERGNLTVSSRSKLSVEDFSMYVSPYAKYFADQSRFYNGQGHDYDYYRTTYNPNSLIVKSKDGMRAENQTLNLLLYNDRWQFVSFPFDVKVSSIVPVDEKTQWVIRSYSGYERAQQHFDQTWVNLAAGDTLKAARGYIMMCFNADADNQTPVEFTVTPVKDSPTRQYLFTNENRTLDLEENVSEFEQNRSWNLIGNPYPCYFDTRYLDTEAPFMVWDSYNRTYAAFSPIDDSYVLNPSEAFFIQRPVDEESLTFRQGGRQTYRNPNDLTVKEVKGEWDGQSQNVRSVYNLTLTNGTTADRTRVVFNEKAKKGYELGRDAAKMMADDSQVPQIWSVCNGVQYAINERPADNGVVELAVRCAEEGTYTIALNANNEEQKVVLEDRLLSLSTELTAEKGYSFSTTGGTFTGRFFLSIRPSEATAIDAIAGNKATDTPAYNLAGQRVGDNQRGVIIKNGKKTINK